MEQMLGRLEDTDCWSWCLGSKLFETSSIIFQVGPISIMFFSIEVLQTKILKDEIIKIHLELLAVYLWHLGLKTGNKCNKSDTLQAKWRPGDNVNMYQVWRTKIHGTYWGFGGHVCLRFHQILYMPYVPNTIKCIYGLADLNAPLTRNCLAKYSNYLWYDALVVSYTY